MAKKSGKSGNKRRPAPPPPVSGSRPWGLIAAATVVVVFAAGVIGYAVKKNVDAKPQDPAKLVAAAKKIEGIQSKQFPSGQHDDNPIAYDTLPPFGGTHANVWADCTGTVYSKPIRDENAVHALEHGAVWITYDPSLPKDQVDTLKDLTAGKPYMLMSPYPGLKDKVSLQAWGYQLFVGSADDKRVKEFITDLKTNPQTTPEYGGRCDSPDFKSDPLSPDQPAKSSNSPSATPSGTSTATPSGTSETTPSATPGT